MPPTIHPIRSFRDVRALVAVHNVVWRGSIGIIELLATSSACYLSKDPETGQVTGYAFVEEDTVRESAELNDIAVAPRFRRKGHGEALLKHVMTQQREIRLCADAKRNKLVRFYYRLGFQKAAVYENYYGVGRDALRLVWRRTEP